MTFLNLLEYFLLAGAVKWHLARKQLVQCDAERPNVAFVAVVAGEYLGGNVVWRSTNVHIGHVLVLCDSETEIDELDEVVATVHDIFWLNVSVNYALRVAMLKRLE